jgi:serine/threonine protein kinase
MILKQRYNKKADIWSLGIIFYEMLCGYFPFDFHNYEDIKNILSKKMKELPNTLTEEASDLIFAMLNKDSNERFSIEEVIGHKFF